MLKKQQTNISDKVVIGHVVAAFGIRGWIKIFPHGDVKKIFSGNCWWLRNQNTAQDTWKEVKVLERSQHGKFVIAHLETYDNRNQAELLKGLQIALPRNLLPSDIQEFDWDELIGLEVINLQNQDLGKVVGLLEARVHDVLRVCDQENKERLLPFVETYIRNIDVKAGRIIVDWGYDW